PGQARGSITVDEPGRVRLPAGSQHQLDPSPLSDCNRRALPRRSGYRRRTVGSPQTTVEARLHEREQAMSAETVAGTGRISVQHLTKWYGAWKALDDVSFEVEPGESLGMWGPNGAGKTTIIRCL